MKKLLQGDGVWDVKKEILGWIFNGVERCIQLPPTKIETIKTELRRVGRMKAVPIKTFESLVGKLRHAAIGMPSGNGLCQPFNLALAHRPAYIYLGKRGAVRQALQDWLHLINDIHRRPTHVNELVPKNITDVCYVDASGRGAGGVWFSTIGDYCPTVWRLEWPQSIISTNNPKGTITNSDLELGGIILAWLVQENLRTLQHKTTAVFCDNVPAVAWATKLASKKSLIAGRLV